MRLPWRLRPLARRKTGGEPVFDEVEWGSLPTLKAGVAVDESGTPLNLAWPEKKVLTEAAYAQLKADFREAMKHHAPAILNFSQGEPAPESAPRHRYGAAGTIHQTGTIDIQIDKITGEVHAVWFRCLQLPFRVSEVRNNTQSNPISEIAIEEITYADLPIEDISQ